MNLDPALQWHKHGHYAGFLWPNEGSDKIFLSYPPLIEFFHILSMYFLPFDIFWMRLPFLIIHVTTAFLLYKVVLKISGRNIWFSLFLVCLFLFDKVVFEISRSMRIEVLECFLIAILFWLHLKPAKYWIRGLVLGLMLLAHLKMWPFVFIYLFYVLVFEKKINAMKNWVIILCSFLPLFLFFWGIDFRFQELYHQMFVQVGKHSAEGNIFNRIWDNIFSRFWPVYKEQAWVIIMQLGLLALAMRRLWKRRFKDLYAILFAGVYLSWMFLLAPQYRYWPPLYFIGLVMLSQEAWLQRIFLRKNAVPLFLCTMPVLLAGFVMRHSLAMAQRTERDPHLAGKWLGQQIPAGEKTLIVGEGLAFYLSNNDNIDFGMEMYPQNLSPKNYVNVFFLSRNDYRFQVVSTYSVQPALIPPWMQKLARGETYARLKLYRINSTEEWKLLTGRYEKDY